MTATSRLDVTVAPIGDLLDRQVLQANSMATVMQDCVAIRDSARRSYTVVAFSDVSRVKRVYVTRPGLLVISAGLLLISAGAFFSREGHSSALPLALVAVAFATGYLLTRRASVVFTWGKETIETMHGPLAQAEELFTAVGAMKFSPRD